MSVASRKRKLEEQSSKLLKEGRERQVKYAKMNDLTKCGHCKAQFLMMDQLKDVKNPKVNKYTKGQIGAVICSDGSNDGN